MFADYRTFLKIATDASLAPTEYFVLNGILSEIKPKLTLEFGPGNSTVVLSRNSETVHTYEPSMQWFIHYSKVFREIGLTNVEMRTFDNAYPLFIHGASKKYDVAFVDSPYGNWDSPGFEGRSRFNTMEFAVERAPIVILHDTKRERESATITHFVQAGMRSIYFNTEKGMTMLYRAEEIPETFRGQ